MKKLMGLQLIFLIGFLLFLIGAIVFYLEDYLTIVVINIIVAILVLGYWMKKNKQLKKSLSLDYDTLFTIGLVLLIVGLASQSSVIWILGLIFFLIGMGNKVQKK